MIKLLPLIIYKHPRTQKERAGYNIFKLQLRESFLQLSCSAKWTCANHADEKRERFLNVSDSFGYTTAYSCQNMTSMTECRFWIKFHHHENHWSPLIIGSSIKFWRIDAGTFIWHDKIVTKYRAHLFSGKLSSVSPAFFGWSTTASWGFSLLHKNNTQQINHSNFTTVPSWNHKYAILKLTLKLNKFKRLLIK